MKLNSYLEQLLILIGLSKLLSRAMKIVIRPVFPHPSIRLQSGQNVQVLSEQSMINQTVPTVTLFQSHKHSQIVNVYHQMVKLTHQCPSQI